MKWKKVSDELPSVNSWLLLKFDGEKSDDESLVRIGKLLEDGEEKYWSYKMPGLTHSVHPTYWMSLPESPHK